MLIRSAFFVLQLLDGFQNTRDHAAGRVPALIDSSGFGSVVILNRWRTACGSLELISARPIGQE